MQSYNKNKKKAVLIATNIKNRLVFLIYVKSYMTEILQFY